MLENILYISYAVLLALAAYMFRKLRFAMKYFNPPAYTSELGNVVDMPSVTVCIPARNEMHALTECLQRVIASDYQKLEIIVLDDVSGDDTLSLIKSFAQDGVRFVQGNALPSGWLGKNHALQGLLNEASGSYLLFMDVDTRISTNAISNMVRYALSQRASMVSVLPRREDGWRASVLFSPLRYFWEVLFHSKGSPATASSAWLINRRVLLDKFDGFSGLKTAIQPESALATQLSSSNEYRFLMSTVAFGISYEKKWRSQLSTSLRLLFPLVNNKSSMAIVGTLDLLVLLAPAVVVIASFFTGTTLVHVVGLFVTVIYMIIYGWYARRVWNKGAAVGALLWPVLILQEMMLIIASAIQYKRRTVKWKGRKVLTGR